MSVVPSLIVLVITALLVFRRELTTLSAAPASKPTPGAKRRLPCGNPSRDFVRELNGLPATSAPAALPCATAGHHPRDIKRGQFGYSR
jgi:hypothetical protein